MTRPWGLWAEAWGLGARRGFARFFRGLGLGLVARGSWGWGWVGVGVGGVGVWGGV